MMDRENNPNNSSSLREAAEAALLRGQVEETFQNIDKAIAAEGRTIDLLLKLELLCAAGKFEKCMQLVEENMKRFEAELTPRERKNSLDPVIRKVAEYLLKSVDSLYAEERYLESLAFSQQALTQHAVFLKAKKYRERFEFAWRSSYDEVLERLYNGGEYAACVDAIDAALNRYRDLTSFWQRNRYRKIRAISHFRLGEYTKGIRDYFSLLGVQAIIVFLLLTWLGLQVGLPMLIESEVFNGAKDPFRKGSPSTEILAPPPNTVIGSAASQPATPLSMIRRAEIKSIRLFEVDGAIPAVTARKYRNQFERQSRRVFVEVHYRNLNFRIADVTMPLVIRYYGPSGALLHEIVSSTSPKKEYESAITSLGWRSEVEGGWPPGRYLVKVMLDGEPVQEVSFEVR
jgi:tetratricopeptide (TPR) repeat protein